MRGRDAVPSGFSNLFACAYNFPMSVVLPYIAAFMAMFCYALLPVLAKKMHASVPPFSLIAVTMFVLMLCSLVASYVTERSFKISSLGLSDFLSLVLFGLINFVGFGAYLFSISKIPVVEYQMIGVLIPLVGGVLAVFLLNEPFLWRYGVGFVFVAVGLYLTLGPFQSS